MADKCFCHLNGFKVKDADARAEIENINNDIENINNDILSISERTEIANKNAVLGINNCEALKELSNIKFNEIDSRFDNVDVAIESLENVGGCMYLHTLKNEDMRFSFYHPQSTAFTVDTLKPYVKNLMVSNNISSLESVILGSGKFNNTNHTYYDCAIVGIGAMGTTDAAPLCLCGIVNTSGEASFTSLGGLSSFTDYVTKL